MAITKMQNPETANSGIDYFVLDTESDVNALSEDSPTGSQAYVIESGITYVKGSGTDWSKARQSVVLEIDIASAAKAGVIKLSSDYATAVNNTTSGTLMAVVKTFEEYESLNDNAFISKGTLNNAIAGKELGTRLVLTSPNKTEYYLKVADDGTLSAELVNPPEEESNGESE